MLSQNALEELKDLYLKHEGRVLSDEEAEEIGTNLLTIVDLVFKAIPKDLLEENKEEFPELVALFKEQEKRA
jgi:hypothetical protein